MKSLKLLLEAVMAVCSMHGKKQIVPGAVLRVRMLCRLEYRVCCVEPPAGERQRSVVCEWYGAASTGPSGMTQPDRVGCET